MLLINFEGREVKGLSKGRYDETLPGEDEIFVNVMITVTVSNTDAPAVNGVIY